MSATGIYFGEDETALFGMLHRPTGAPSRATAIVIVPPLGYEAICSARTLRHLADELAKRGFWVLRYDHSGTGDSAGELGDPERVAAWIAGVRCAATGLMAKVGATGVALVGLRAGALLALAGACGQDAVKSLVLWALPHTGRALVRELRALAGLGRSDAGTGTVESAGFGFRAQTLAELGRLDARELTPEQHTRVLMVPRDDIEPPPPIAHGAWIGRAEVLELPGYAALMRDPHESDVPASSLEAIAGWIDAAHPEVGGHEPIRVRTRSRIVAHAAASEAVIERAVRFGSDQRLFGIVSEPHGARADAPWVLWLNPGAIHHIGMNRNYVSFARALAGLGIASLRFDISGIGESPPNAGAPENQLYSTHAVPDVAAAIDHLVAAHGARRFALAGLCSGAYTAFHAALADPRVDSVIMINPQTFDYRPGDSLAIQRRAAFKAARWYRRSLRDAASWKKALRGQVDFARVVRLLGSRVFNLARDRAARLSAPPPEQTALARSFRTLLGRGAELLLVYSADDPGLEHLKQALGPELDELAKHPRLELCVIDGPDHTFTPIWSQQRLQERITHRLIEHVGAGQQAPPGSLLAATNNGSRSSTTKPAM